jgi:outer membrane receptor protein involved in Fe transport
VNQLQVIYDPLTTRLVNGAYVRDPFPGNVIPADRINPVAANVLSLVPLGNTQGNAVTGLNNLATSGNSRKFTDYFPSYTGRVDYNINESTRMFVRYSRNALSEQRSFRYSTTSEINIAETGNNSPFTRENHSATIQLTRTISPTTVLDVRFGLARFRSQSGSVIGLDGINGLGFAPQFLSQASTYFPRFSWANYEGAGATPSFVDPTAQTNSFQTSVFKIISRHSLKLGGEYRLQRAYGKNQGFSAGNFNFTQQFTGNSATAVNASTGNAVASFLLGYPQDAYIDVNSEPARQQNLFSVYVQDDIRVTERLKLNVGVRWDYLGPLTDRFDALTTGFDTSSPFPISVPGISLTGGLRFAGVGGNGRGAFQRDWNNFAPRIGVAYRLGDKTLLRGGYGLMYAQVFDDPGGAPGFSQRTQMVSSVETGVPFNTLTNPFPNGILTPAGNSQGLATFVGQAFNFSNPNRELPYTHQFSFEIQHELPFRLLMTAGYVGSRVRRLSVSKPFNEISLESLNRGTAFLSASVPNPMFGYLPSGTSVGNPTITNQQLLRPYPQFLAITELNRSEGSARYDGFQFLLTRRFSKGVTASASYTYSRTLEWVSYRNAQDTALEKNVASWDVPQSLQLNGVWELPFGVGRAFLTDSPRFARVLVSGWEVSGIARLQSGMPLTLGTNTVPTGASPVYEDQSLDRWLNTCTLLANGSTANCLSGETPAWTVRPANTLQNWSSRITSVRTRGIRNLDVALMKRTTITERVTLTIRGELMNATNTPQFFNGPSMDVNNGNFGRISGALSQSNLPRFGQLSMKLEF